MKQISKWNWQHPLTFSLQLILPRAMLEGVRAGHLQVHMNNSGLLTTFLRPGLIYKSACAVSDLHIFSVFMDIVCIHVSMYFSCWLLCEYAGRAWACSVNNNVHHSVSLVWWTELAEAHLLSSACAFWETRFIHFLAEGYTRRSIPLSYLSVEYTAEQLPGKQKRQEVAAPSQETVHYKNVC